MGVDDAALIKRWRADRDGEAFAELVARYSGLVYGACRRLTRDNGRSEDLTQECFLKLARSRPVVKGSLGPWLHRVATNLALDEVRASDRRARREKGYTLDKVEPAEPEWSDIEPIVDEAVQALPDLVRVPIVLHFYEGHTQEAIAELTDAPRSTIANRIKRGVEEVRKFLRRRGVEIPAAALTAFLATELVTAAPAGLTTSIGKAALAERLPQPVASGVSLAGRIAIVSAVIAVIGLTIWLRPEGPDAPDTLATEETVQKAAAAPSIPVEDGALVEAEPEEAAEAPPEKEIQPTAELAPEDDPKSIPGPSVRGTVTDSSGNPIPGAFVRLIPDFYVGAIEEYLHRYGKAYTDRFGNYSIDTIQFTGQILVSSVAPGFLDQERRLRIAQTDERVGIDFTLEESYDFTGHVLDPSGAPVQGALVMPLRIERHSGAYLFRYWRLTDEAGLFSFGLQRLTDFIEDRQSPDDWKDRLAQLEISTKGHGSRVFHGVFLTSSEVVDFRLLPPASLYGTVTAVGGEPLASYTVSIRGTHHEVATVQGELRTGWLSPRKQKTDANGRYEFPDLPPNWKYSVALQDDARKSISIGRMETPILEPGGAAQLDIAAKLGVTLSGDVLGSINGVPVPITARVTALDMETLRPVGATLTMHGASSYSMRLPESGTYLVGANYLLFLDEDQEGNVPFGERNADGMFAQVDVGPDGLHHDVTVPEPFALRVRVVDTAGYPMEGAEVRLSRMHPGYTGDLSAPASGFYSDRDGRYIWRTMPEREVWISATAEGLTTARSGHFIGEPGGISPEIELVLRRPGGVFGRLVNPDGETVQNGRLRVSVSTSQGENISKTGISIDGGAFYFPGVLAEDHLLITLVYNRREIWTEPYVHEGPADVDLDFGDITVWPEP